MNNEPIIEIPVHVQDGIVKFLYRKFALKKDISASLQIPAGGFQNPEEAERLVSLTETFEILPAGTILHAPMKDIGDKEIILEEPLELKFRGTKKATLEDCGCSLPSLGITAKSVNHAYTKLSEKFEPKRRSHTANVFNTILYLPKGQHNWRPLEELRQAKQIEFQKKLFS